MPYGYTFKVVTIGDVAVGKTSLINRYLKDEFRPEYFPTVQANVSEKIFNLKDFTFKLTIWDSPGERSFNEMSKEFYMNAHAAVIVFEVSRRSSFEHISDWYRRAVNFMRTQPVIYFVGNKKDLGLRQVERGEAEEKAKQYGARYFETSAKTGENVAELYDSLLRDLLEQRLEELKARLGVKR